ncbi:hypothetical protein PGTUg99_002726 [Puccinia graminis f. sp. tritici]|uniref:Uncharacterized protein n=1 Tax=Puccinia graminis f. sp. tritici TaxID=56615 RepID=A0A5B0RC90_PUCGR|nr:hypothetical protein PGTUg99_002726 [Puccinia graminis f. sp. tritici]
MAPPEYLGPDKSHFVDPMFDLTQNSYQENKTNMINRGEVKADEADLKFDRDYQEPLNPQYRFQSDSTKRQKLNNHDGVISYQPAGHPGTHPDSKICRATHDNGLLDFGCEILKEEQTVKDFHFISSLPEATTNTAQHTHGLQKPLMLCYPQIQAGERNESSFTMKDAPDLLRILGNTISNQHEKDNSKSPDHSPINNQEILSQEPITMKNLSKVTTD